MRRSILAALALCLLVPATATAKFSAVRICGPSECHTVTLDDQRTLLAMEKPILDGMEASDLGQTNGTERPSSSASDGPWYRVTLCPERCGVSAAESLRLLPAAGYAQLQGRWIELDDRAISAYRTAVRSVRPYEPASAGVDPPSSNAGLPAWGWVLIGAAVLGVGLLGTRLVRRARPPPPS